MSTITSVVVPLLGVVVGAGGALFAQYLSTRVTKQQARAAAEAAARIERKETILAYLQAMQGVEQAAEQRYMDGELPEDYPARVHNMWFQQKCIEIVGSPGLIDKAKKYVWCLHAAIYRELPEGMTVWQFIEQDNQPFIAAAREELGLTS